MILFLSAIVIIRGIWIIVFRCNRFYSFRHYSPFATLKQKTGPTSSPPPPACLVGPNHPPKMRVTDNCSIGKQINGHNLYLFSFFFRVSLELQYSNLHKVVLRKHFHVPAWFHLLIIQLNTLILMNDRMLPRRDVPFFQHVTYGQRNL